MSLIKADLLRAAKWKSEPVQLPVSAREEPGLGSRLGGESRSPSASSGCWAHWQQVRRGAGGCAPTPGCRHPRADPARANTAQRQGRAAPAPGSGVEIGWLSEAKSRSWVPLREAVLGRGRLLAPAPARAALRWAASEGSEKAGPDSRV